jgi:hypothetical protein
MATIAEQMQMRGAQVFPQMPTAPNVNQVAPPQFQSPSVATSPVPSMPQQPTMPAGTPTPSAASAMPAPAPSPPTPAGGGLMNPNPVYDDSAASNLAKITSSDSPLMQMAGAAGMASANRRGLLNSTMAVGAAQGEVIKAATPIAIQDATTAGQKNMQNTDVAAQKERLQISNDAAMSQLQRQLANANEQQAKDIQAQMDRLRETNTAEMARLDKQGQIQGGLQTQTDAAAMERLRETNNANTAMSAQQFQQQGMLNDQQSAAEMARLTTQLAGANAQQRADIQGQMDRLVYGAGAEAVKQQRDIENQRFMQTSSLAAASDQQKADIAARMSELTTQITSQQTMQSQNLSEEARRQQVQLGVQQAMQTAEFANLNQQQKTDIAAQMERLVTSGTQELDRLKTASVLEGDRMKLQNTLDTALQTTGAQQQQMLAQVQGDIQSKLQAQTDTAAMGRLSAQFAQDLKVQSSENQAALQRIAASGDQNVRQALVTADQARQDLAMQLASGDREKVANTAVQIFAAEAAMRQALLSNTTMPAAERSAYEAAIASLGNPVRNFVNQLYGGAQQTTGASTGGAPIMGGVSTAMVAPAPTVGTVAGGGDLGGGGLLNQAATEELSAIQRRQQQFLQ